MKESASNGSHGSLRMYVTGFFLSIILTLAAYLLVDQHVNADHAVWSHSFLMIAVVVLALLQMVVQLVCFLHLGRESRPYWNLVVFLYAFLLVAIIVIGSLWVMHHLNYNMGAISVPGAHMEARSLE
ncbi:cytochrome o ubiquinol oxidase subunit IV [Candidatus Kaiserbacteria bacterium]|nr:cytochrome o ubiquinol oxidase subunit IV [Candidatus Kaiserbacteria bacterium]